MSTSLSIPRFDATTPVGVVGLGVMGAGIARTLRRKAFAVTVFNRDPAKTEPLLAVGACVGRSPMSVGAAAWSC